MVTRSATARVDVEEYREHGVTVVRGALEPKTLAALEAIYADSLAAPSPFGMNFYADDGTTFFQDMGNMSLWPRWTEALRNSALPDILATLWGSEDVWFYYEQVFLKEGGLTRRTPWHQDASYLPIAGEKIANVWTSFDAVVADHALEFVRGSHRGVLYSPSAFDPADDTAPLDPMAAMPRLPDIQASRDKFDIVSWPIEPGDVVVFHIALLHGGAATGSTGRRRTVALRCFGDDAVFAPRDAAAPVASDAPTPELLALYADLQPGQRLSEQPRFPKLRG